MEAKIALRTVVVPNLQLKRTPEIVYTVRHLVPDEWGPLALGLVRSITMMMIYFNMPFCNRFRTVFNLIKNEK